jgi:hypothetical protein
MSDELKEFLKKQLNKDRPAQQLPPPPDERPPENTTLRNIVAAVPALYIAINTIAIITERRDADASVLALMALAGLFIYETFNRYFTHEFYLNGTRAAQSLILCGALFVVYLLYRDGTDMNKLDLGFLAVSAACGVAILHFTW